MKAVRLDALRAAAKTKPKGYIDDVMSFAVKQDDDHVFLETEDYYTLRDKYSGETDFPVHGPGTNLHHILGTFGIHMSKGCSCRGRMIQMNKWGVAGCEKKENFDTIVGWMEEEARKRKLPFLRPLARALVRNAIAKSRKASTKEK